MSKAFEIVLLASVLSFVSPIVAENTDNSDNQTSEQINCYEFETVQSPVMEELSGAEKAKETWCYWRSAELDATVVFNPEGELRPELTAIRQNDRTVIFGSLLKGEISYYRMRDTLSPFNAPLEEPKDMSPVDIPISNEKVKILKGITTQSLAAPSQFISTAVQPGSYSGSVPRSALPWRGYWWPHNRRELASSYYSPMAKFDDFARARGVRSHARDWELRNHGSGPGWFGHCNGWAAASVLRAEPRVSRRDPQTGIVFSVSDQKGLLTEKDYCIRHRFVGDRYGNSYNDNIWDIAPNEFHKTLVYYIGSIGKPVLMDYDRTHVVFHNVISGYQMRVTQTGSREFRVRTEVRSHKFDDGASNAIGVAQVNTRVYEYLLYTDGDGQIVSGRWLSSNPDFLWIALSPARCGKANPHVEESLVKQIISLPFAR